MSGKRIIGLADLRPQDVPPELRVESYFDFQAHPFAHQALFAQTGPCVLSALPALHGYLVNRLHELVSERQASAAGHLQVMTQPDLPSVACRGTFQVITEEGASFQPRSIWGPTVEQASVPTVYVEAGAVVFGCDINLTSGSIHIGQGTIVEPGVGLHGPTILGSANLLRQGAYLRGDVLVGDDCVLRGEYKNVVMMNNANFPHPCYVGDSLCGYMSHFGNQATAANLGIFQGILPRDKRRNIILDIGDLTIDIGTSKLGIILGDYSQVGCNSVADPGTFLRPRTIVYALTRINRGFYGPDEVLKNKPMEHGVIERAPFL